MNLDYRRPMIAAIFLVTGGLCLSCDSGLPDQHDGTAIPAASPALPRDFAFSGRLFAAASAWNQTVAGAAVLPDSGEQILVTYRVLRGDTSYLSPGTEPPNWPFMDVNYDEYAFPVFRMGTGQQSVLVCDYDGNLGWTNPKLPISEEGGPVTVPAPAGTVRPAGPQDTDADGHLVLYNPDTLIEYDYWQATTVRTGECSSLGGGRTGTTILEAGMIDFFDTSDSGTNPDTYSSARATGVPLLAGLILPEDVESGAIEHALAFAIPGPRNTNTADPYEPFASDYFYPASTTEGDFCSTDPHALAAGQRIRLKQALVDDQGDPLDENQLAPITRMFLAALRSYGAYLVDNAGGFTFYAEDIHTAVLDLTDDEVNSLIGEVPGTPLPTDKTKWQMAIEKLNEDLEQIPIAYGPWTDGQDPATAQITASNFEVVAAATYTTASVYQPVVLRDFTASSPSDLSAVNDFLYQLQNLDLTAIGDTAYDLVVMDYSSDGSETGEFTATQIATLKQSPGGDKIVLAYMSIGEAEDYRFYWQGGWTPGSPAWLDAENPDWPGNYKVHYWDPGWQSIILDYTDRLLDAGFDGAYLDIIDAYEYYTDRGRASAAQEMADFVASIRAHARAHDPDFFIFPQNAPELAGLVPAYLNSVDGIGQEDIYYGYDDDDVMTPPAVTAELEGYLDVFKSAGKLVLTVDYATTPAHVDDAYAKSQTKGYVPFVTVRDLDQLMVNLGHEPD